MPTRRRKGKRGNRAAYKLGSPSLSDTSGLDQRALKSNRRPTVIGDGAEVRRQGEILWFLSSACLLISCFQRSSLTGSQQTKDCEKQGMNSLTDIPRIGKKYLKIECDILYI